MGERLPLGRLGGVEPARIAALESSGLRAFASSGLSPEEMAYEAARTALARSGGDPADVGALVYCTTMLTVRSAGFSYEGVNALLERLGLRRAYPLGIFLSHCSNLVAGIRTARNLVLAEGLEHVLVVSTDKAGDDRHRLMKDDLSVLSDGACACIVSSAPGPFSIDGIAQHIDTGLRAVANPIQSLKRNSDGIRAPWSRLRESLGWEADGVRAVMTGNYNLNTLQFMRLGLGMRDSQMFLGNVPRNAHAFSADLLINFEDYLRQRGARNGDRFLVFGAGNERWGAVALSCREDAPAWAGGSGGMR